MHSSKRDTAVAGRRTSGMKELTNRNYLEHINEKSGISILEFYSPSCTHCKKMEGAFTKLEETKEVDATFIKCNTADEGALALRYDISSVPTTGCPMAFLTPQTALVEGSIGTQTTANAALRPRSGRLTAAARTLLHRSTTPPVRLNTPPPAATLSSTSNGTAGANCGWHSPARNTLRNSTPTS